MKKLLIILFFVPQFLSAQFIIANAFPKGFPTKSTANGNPGFVTNNVIPPPIVFDADAQKLIDSAVITNAGVKLAVNTLVVSLKGTARGWINAKWIHPHATDNNLSNFAHLAQMKWNLVDIRDVDAAFRLTSNGTLTADSIGVKGDGTTGYRSTHAKQSTFLPDTNSNTLLYSSATNQNRFETQMGARDFISSPFTITNLYLTVSNSSLNYANISDGPPDIAHGGLANTTGTYAGTRVTSTKTYVYRNGSVLDSGSNASAGFAPNVDITINARGNGPADQFSSSYISFDAAWNKGLTHSEIAAITTIINQYLKDMETALGLAAGKKGSF